MENKDMNNESKVVSSELIDTNINQDEIDNQAVIEETTEGSEDRQLTEITKTLESGGKVPYEEFKKVAQLVFLSEDNREINKNHVNKLVEDFKETKIVLEAIEVIPAETALKKGCVVKDGKDKEITLETKNLKKLFCIGDGQHRAVAIEMYKIKFPDKSIVAHIKLADIPKDMTISKFIKKRNFFQKSWDYNAISKAAIKSGSEEATRILSKAQENKEKYKMSYRATFKIYHLSDVYQKKDVEATSLGQSSDNLKGTNEQYERGNKILDAFLTGFREHPALLKNSAAIDNFISCYMSAPDEKKKQCVENLIAFYKGISESTLSTIEGEVSIPDKQKAFRSAYDKFIEEWEKPESKATWEKAIEKAKNEYQEKVQKEKQEKEEAKKEPEKATKKKSPTQKKNQIKEAIERLTGNNE